MTPQHHLPADIERTSLSIITKELDEMGLTPPPETAAVVKRVIHTTADFDYAKNLRFTPGAVEAAVRALHAGVTIVTDTNMALAGISKPGLAKLGCEAVCYMADPAGAEAWRPSFPPRGIIPPWPKPPSRRALPGPWPPCTEQRRSTRGPFSRWATPPPPC